MFTAKQRRAIRDSGIADTYRFMQSGQLVVRREYFYHRGRTAEAFGANVLTVVRKAVGATAPFVVQTRDRFAQWPRHSYFEATITPGHLTPEAV